MSGRYYKGSNNKKCPERHVIFASTRSPPNGKRHDPAPARQPIGQRPSVAAASVVGHTRTRTSTTAGRGLEAITPYFHRSHDIFTICRLLVFVASYSAFHESRDLFLFLYEFPVYRFVCFPPLRGATAADDIIITIRARAFVLGIFTLLRTIRVRTSALQ